MREEQLASNLRYKKYQSYKKHLTGKKFTQRIERTHLTLRIRIKRLNRKTIGYSKSEEIHDKVIGTFIEREHYF
ncbi:IS1 transposase [Xenorhabdus cabanillasii]|uniref:IS1 transposase n=1 Tax=Xenorhabdus cabanillasii TaxID=351673 RepID=A0A3D9U9D5_9GAMM|nr:transposase [Xenorhabdus cabanillasii JM26]REF26069.1 IS1 transposase [Xenorhabdus cabanillasii]